MQDRRDADDGTNASDRKRTLKAAASMPILGQRTVADNDENRRERLHKSHTDAAAAAAAAALPDGGDDDDLPRPALTKTTSCYYVQQTAEQPTSDKPSSGADDK